MEHEQPSSQQADIQTSHLALLIDHLNVNIGFCGALVVEKHRELKKENFLNSYAEYITLPDEKEEDSEYDSSDSRKELPPLVKDYGSIANFLTQIQHDLYDLKLLVTDTVNERFATRIDDKAITWLDNISNSIASNLPDSEGAILPVGNQIATNLFLASNLSEQLELTFTQSQKIYVEQIVLLYLSTLSKFLTNSGCWANVTQGEKIWTWNPASESETNSAHE